MSARRLLLRLAASRDSRCRRSSPLGRVMAGWGFFSNQGSREAHPLVDPTLCCRESARDGRAGLHETDRKHVTN